MQRIGSIGPPRHPHECGPDPVVQSPPQRVGERHPAPARASRRRQAPAAVTERAAQTGDLGWFLGVARRRLPIILLTIALTAGAAVAFALLQDEEYTAEASLLFRDPQLDEKLFGSTLSDTIETPEREAETNLQLVSLDVVAERTALELRSGLSGKEISERVDVSPEGQSDVVSISATTSTPESAARTANVFAKEYIAFRRKADRSKIRDAQRLVQRQLRRLEAGEEVVPPDRGSTLAPPETGTSDEVISSLEARAEDLQVLASLQSGNAELVQRAEPPVSPSSTQPARAALIGSFVGLLLGVGLAFGIEQLDRRLKRPQELSDAFGVPLVAEVAKSRSLRRRRGGLALPPAEAEAFRILRANLRYFDATRDLRSLLITSPAPQDGKSTVALQLAVAAAEAGARVLLIEADLRHPRLAAELRLAEDHGLSTVLASRRGEVASPVHTIAVESRVNGSSAGASFDILTAGPIPPNPVELFESQAMSDLIWEAQETYELVIIDTAPISIVSDAIPLLRQVSGVLVVGRVNGTTRDAARDLREQLSRLDAPTLGVVANFARAPDRQYYGYRATTAK